ncbi:MAG: cytidylate kinase-like family protein [Clostridia bacterium]|nr:cytidylate kinase-like family protein [Clostridia bacterium]
MKNVVIAIGREFGSGGRAVAKELSEIMGIKFYDKDLIRLTAKESGYSEELLHGIDESASSSLLYTLSMSATHNIAMNKDLGVPVGDKAFAISSEIIKKLADEESCIIVGRCADSILNGRDNLIKVFIYTDVERRIDRICEYEKCSRSEAASMIKKADRRRSFYHNYYSDTKWGDRRSYDICIDSSIGIDKVAKIIKYIAENK